MPRQIKQDYVVEDKGSKVVKDATKNINDSLKKTTQKSKESSASMELSWKTITIAIAATYAAYKTLEAAINATKMGSQLLIQEEAFTNLAESMGVNAQSMIDDLKDISNETITTAELMESAGTAMLLGIPADKLDDLMRIARTSMKITGQTAQAAFSDIATAVGRQSKMILDNLGIILDLDVAYENYAATVGKTVDQLDDAEKKMAFLNETIRIGEEFIKNIGETTGNEFEEINILVTNVKESFDDLYTLLAKNLNPMLKVLNKYFDELKIILVTIVAIPILIFITSLAAGLFELSVTMATLIGVSGFGGMMRQLPLVAKNFEIAGKTGAALAGRVSALSGVLALLNPWVVAVVVSVGALHLLFKDRDLIDKYRDSLKLTKEGMKLLKEETDETAKAVDNLAIKQLAIDIINLEKIIARGPVSYDIEDPFGGAEKIAAAKRELELARISMIGLVSTSKELTDTMSGLEDFWVGDEAESSLDKITDAMRTAQINYLKLIGKTQQAEIELVKDKYVKLIEDAKGHIDTIKLLNINKNLEIAAIDKKYSDEKREKDLESFEKLAESLGMSVNKSKALYEADLEAYKIASETKAEIDAEALEKLSEMSQMVQDIGKSAMISFSVGMTGALLDWIDETKTAEEAFKSFAASFLRQIAQMIIQQTILNAIKSSSIGGFLGFEHGGVIQGGKVTPFNKGGIVNAPTIFPMANGAGLMGEAGPEAVMPLKRGPSGRLGVEASGGGRGDIINHFEINVNKPIGSDEDARRQGKILAMEFNAGIDKRLIYQSKPGGLLRQPM